MPGTAADGNGQQKLCDTTELARTNFHVPNGTFQHFVDFMLQWTEHVSLLELPMSHIYDLDDTVWVISFIRQWKKHQMCYLIYVYLAEHNINKL